MIDLSTLEPQKISRNLQGKSFLFYGDAGVGKTTLASKFPKSLILGLIIAPLYSNVYRKYD